MATHERELLVGAILDFQKLFETPAWMSRINFGKTGCSSGQNLAGQSEALLLIGPSIYWCLLQIMDTKTHRKDGF